MLGFKINTPGVHKSLYLIPMIVLSFLSIGPVSAEEPAGPVTLDAVVVTAEPLDETFETGDVDKEQTPAFFSVIEREQFEGKIESLSEVIEKEAGIQVRQTGGLGSFSTISLRGSTSDQVMVFMDGILLNDASGGGVDLSNIALSDVEAIEIYRGISPINFGKASIGGMVNIRTLRTKKGLDANLSAGYGSFNTRKLSGFLNHKPSAWDYLISADYLGSDNDFEFLNDNGTQWNTADDRWEKRNNAQFDQENLLAKVGFDAADDVRLDLVNQWFSKDQGLPSWNNSEFTKTSFDVDRNITTLKLNVDNVGPYHLNTSTRISYLWKREKYDDSEGHVGLGKQLTEYLTDRYDADFFLEWLTDRNTLTITLAAQREEYETRDLLGKTNPNDSTRNMFNFGVQGSLALFDDRLIITPALRHTVIKDELRSGTSVWGLPLEGKSRQEEYTCPQIGLKYQLSDWITLKSNVAEYVREPSFFELFGDRGFFIGNDELKAEQGMNLDAGLEISWLPENRLLQRISLNAAYFKSDVEDLITRVYDARGIGKSVNISESEIRGIESGINIDFLNHFRLVGNATMQDTENKSEIGAFQGKKLPGRFENSYLARIEARYKGFKAYYEEIVEEGIYYDTANLLKAEDKKEVNAGMSWLVHSFLLTFEAKNLEDDQYEDFNGYPLPGRSYYFTVKYSL
jgi:iron complex outermembrane receptor protein